MAFKNMLIVDGLQYINWTRELFQQARDGGLDTIHVTIAYWENTSETLSNLSQWRTWFTQHADLIMPVHTGQDILAARDSNRVGIVLGFQNCSPIEDDLSRVEVMHKLGVRIMQLSYNNQSLLATGCYEDNDSGITRFGREVIREMNRVGMVIDMSHSAETSTLQAIELSSRPITISHANPASFHSALRNKSAHVLKALGESGGMLGVSLYPFHLANGSDCTLKSFCHMVYATAELIGIEHLGIGSDLCLNWDYRTLEWMRSGRWSSSPDYGEGNASLADWPAQPEWFANHLHFENIVHGLNKVGFEQSEIARIMGQNWQEFFTASFSAASH